MNTTKESTVATTKPDKPADEPKAQPKALIPAGTSSDPEVHHLLAVRETHRLNSEPDPGFPQQRDEALAAIEQIDVKLEELGYTAK